MPGRHREYCRRHDHNYALIHAQLPLLWLPMCLVYLVLVLEALIADGVSHFRGATIAQQVLLAFNLSNRKQASQNVFNLALETSSFRP